jgi:hypothetical protein
MLLYVVTHLYDRLSALDHVTATFAHHCPKCDATPHRTFQVLYPWRIYELPMIACSIHQEMTHTPRSHSEAACGGCLPATRMQEGSWAASSLVVAVRFTTSPTDLTPRMSLHTDIARPGESLISAEVWSPPNNTCGTIRSYPVWATDPTRNMPCADSLCKTYPLCPLHSFREICTKLEQFFSTYPSRLCTCP